MNPNIPADYTRPASGSQGFVRSHAKRESPRIEALVETGGAREGRSYGVRLTLDGRTTPPPGSPPIELDFREVAEGRPRFAWCAALGERIRASARELLAAVPDPPADGRTPGSGAGPPDRSSARGAIRGAGAFRDRLGTRAPGPRTAGTPPGT